MLIIKIQLIMYKISFNIGNIIKQWVIKRNEKSLKILRTYLR